MIVFFFDASYDEGFILLGLELLRWWLTGAGLIYFNNAHYTLVSLHFWRFLRKPQYTYFELLGCLLVYKSLFKNWRKKNVKVTKSSEHLEKPYVKTAIVSQLLDCIFWLIWNKCVRQVALTVFSNSIHVCQVYTGTALQKNIQPRINVASFIRVWIFILLSKTFIRSSFIFCNII